MIKKTVLSPSSLFKRMRCALTEPVMGFFALLALALAFAPELFDFRPAVLRVFDLTEWVIVGVFAAEYAVNFVFADRRRDYFWNPWRLIDLGIVIAALASALPQVNDNLRSSPIIRIMRLLRIILFGARASGSIAGRIDTVSTTDTADTVHVSIFRAGEPISGETTIDDLLSCTRDHVNDQWCHGSGIHGSFLEDIAKAA